MTRNLGNIDKQQHQGHEHTHAHNTLLQPTLRRLEARMCSRIVVRAVADSVAATPPPLFGRIPRSDLLAMVTYLATGVIVVATVVVAVAANIQLAVVRIDL